MSFTNIVGTDVVSPTGTATVNTTARARAGNPIVGTYTQTLATGLAGTDAGNYSFGTAFTSAANYTINQLALTAAVASQQLDLRLGARAGGGELHQHRGHRRGEPDGHGDGQHDGTSTRGNPIVGTYTQTLATGLAGTDAGNYTFARRSPRRRTTRSTSWR